MILARVVALALALPALVHAQMTVTGRVTSGDLPIRGATVTVRELDISARTNTEGQYSFIIRAAQVRGQTVTIMARHSRYGSQSAQLQVTGESVVQDFTLRAFEQPATRGDAPPTVAREETGVASRNLDSTALLGATGPLDVASALAGQIPGLEVISASADGSSRMVFRGSRSLHGSAQPLIVIDGVALENSSFTTALQQFGLGGFDYGTRLQDIALDDIATISVLHGTSAVPLYGGRAANGVVVITTKRGGSGRGFDPVVSLRFSGESPIRLPAFQNRYGQGLAGQFEFFDGQGGGINDDVDQNWGPALDGQPIPQSSYTEPRRPDVRYWLAHPTGFDNYFGAGRTIDANIALHATRQWASGRIAVNARKVNGVLPNSSTRRLGMSLNGTAQPSPRLSGRATFQFIDVAAENRHATGFDEVNAIAGFTRTGRQVDLDALRAPITSGTEQINWIYTGRNNPFFQPFRNANDDARTHVRGGGALSYEVGRGVSLTLNVGVEDSNEERNVNVATEWFGTYPTAIGRRDFSGGGTERQTIAIAERTIGLAVSSAPWQRFGLSFDATAGVEKRNNDVGASTAVIDTATVVAGDTSATDVTSLYVLGSISRTNKIFLDGGLRVEQASHWPSSLGSAFFPSASITYDVLRDVGALSRTLRLGTARLRASWWEAGNEITPPTLRRIYAGGGTSTVPTLGAAFDSVLPERTRGLEFTTQLASTSGRIALDASVYSERSRDVLLATPFFTGQAAKISNRGLNGQVRFVAIGDTTARGSSWSIAASVARNRNKVERLGGSLEEVALSPSQWGAFLIAREGDPLGVIVGTRFMRDSASGALILKNGLPIPDDVGLVRLGRIEPDWTGSLRNRLRFGAAELSFLIEAHMGGHMFSATNLWGSYAGSLESTLAGRETGLLIAGIDSVSRQTNTDSVTTEDYFHALGAIHEAWVYDASYWKLREVRFTYSLPMRLIPGLREHVMRASIVTRNLMTWAKAPNIDPETALSTGVFQGFEMGQLPTTRSIGLQIHITP